MGQNTLESVQDAIFGQSAPNDGRDIRIKSLCSKKNQSSVYVVYQVFDFFVQSEDDFCVFYIRLLFLKLYPGKEARWWI